MLSKPLNISRLHCTHLGAPTYLLKSCTLDSCLLQFTVSRTQGFAFVVMDVSYETAHNQCWFNVRVGPGSLGRPPQDGSVSR